MTGANKGMIFRGGSVTFNGPVAVGKKAHAASYVQAAGPVLDGKDLSGLRVKLDAMLALLDRHGDRLNDPEMAYELVGRTAKELGQEKPDKLNLTGWLTQLVDATKSVAEIATAAVSLKGVVAGLF